MTANFAIEQLSSSLNKLNCSETARSSASYRDALDNLHATVMHLSPPRQNAALQSCRSSARRSRQRSSRHNGDARFRGSASDTARGTHAHDLTHGAVLSSRLRNSKLDQRREGQRTARLADQELIPQSEMWTHTQTVPGYIGGNMLLRNSRLPRTSRVRMRGALPMRADAMPRRSVQNEALSSIDARGEASELWTMQDHFLKKSFFKPIGF